MRTEYILVAIDPDDDRVVMLTSDSFHETVRATFNEMIDTLVQMAADDDDLNTPMSRNQIGALTVEMAKYMNDDPSPELEEFKSKFRTSEGSITVRFPYSLEGMVSFEVMRYNELNKN
jgi:hypothetical protein